jgi:4-amino-4-deoxy-L-arabinose transferase-like glycosyltransferase
MKKYEKLILAAIIVLAFYLRFYNLATNPLWYTDESNYIGVANHLMSGEVRYGAIKYPYATEQLPQPFLFFILNGIVIKVLGVSMFSARFLSALIGVVCLLPIFNIGRRLSGPSVGLLAALIFTLHYYSVLFFRWGMPYNLSMLFNIMALYYILRYEESADRKMMLLAAASAGLSAVSSFYGLASVLFIWLYALIKGLRKNWHAVLISIIPFVIFAIWGISHRGLAFTRDFALLFLQITPERIALLEQAKIFARGMLNFVSYDFVYYLGILGLLLWKGKGRLLLYYFLFLIPLIIKKQGLDPSVKYNSTIYIFCIHLGLAYLIVRVYKAVEQNYLRKLLLIVFCVVAISAAGIRVYQVATHIPSEYEPVGSVKSIEHAKELAAFVNSRVNKEDYVIAPERMYWLLQCKTANLYQATAYDTGGTTWHYGLSPDRFAFDCSYKNASFIILDHTDRTIILHPSNPNMDYIPNRMAEERWHQTGKIGEYQIFKNPRLD